MQGRLRTLLLRLPGDGRSADCGWRLLGARVEIVAEAALPPLPDPAGDQVALESVDRVQADRVLTCLATASTLRDSTERDQTVFTRGLAHRR